MTRQKRKRNNTRWPGVRESAAILGCTYEHLLLCIKGRRKSRILMKRYKEIKKMVPTSKPKYSPEFKAAVLGFLQKEAAHIETLTDITRMRCKEMIKVLQDMSNAMSPQLKNGADNEISKPQLAVGGEARDPERRSPIDPEAVKAENSR